MSKRASSSSCSSSGKVSSGSHKASTSSSTGKSSTSSNKAPVSSAMASSSSGKDLSHGFPVQMGKASDTMHPGHPYSQESLRVRERVMRSPANTSYTTPSFNRGQNRVAENEIAAVFKGEMPKSQMTPAAERRYDVQGGAWGRIRCGSSSSLVAFFQLFGLFRPITARCHQ